MRNGVAWLLLAAVVLASPCAAPAAEEAHKVLRVGTSGDYAPFSIRVAPEGAAEDGGAEAGVRYDGFDVEVARRFAADRGYELEIVPFRWPDLSRDLKAGRFDVAMGGVTVRGDRSVVGTFTVPVVVSHAVAVTWKGSGIDSLLDLNRPSRRIAVNRGGYLEGVARRRFSQAMIVPMPENQAVHMALMDRWTDAVVTDSFEEKAWTATATDVVRIGPLSEDRKAYLVRADREQLAAELSEWILARERDGTLARLRARKLGAGTHVAAADPLSALTASIIERAGVMPLVWAAKREMERPVEDKAQEARVLEGAIEATNAAARARRVEPPEPSQVRRLFKDLIEAGKDVQERLADEERSRRLVSRRNQEAIGEQAADGGSGAPDGDAAGGAASGAVDSGAADADAAAADDEPLSSRVARASRGAPSASSANLPLFDLETEIRPALGRLTRKIAMLVVLLDDPVSIEAVHKRLADGLSEHRIPAPRIEMIATAVAALAASNADKR